MFAVKAAALLLLVGSGWTLPARATDEDTNNTVVESTDPPVNGTVSSRACHWECPICPPGRICAAGPCYLRCPRPASPCRRDEDCKLLSDYCDGCNCRAVRTNQQLPHCSGRTVQCFADPCLQKKAACVNKRCAVR